MKTTDQPTEYTIDAQAKSLGRVASVAAKFLRGKGLAAYERHLLPGVKVSIINASKLRLLPKKMRGKIYRHYSGYPGGLKEETLAARVRRQGWSEIVRRAVSGMIPANKLKAKLLKQLAIED